MDMTVSNSYEATVQKMRERMEAARKAAAPGKKIRKRRRSVMMRMKYLLSSCGPLTRSGWARFSYGRIADCSSFRCVRLPGNMM